VTKSVFSLPETKVDNFLTAALYIQKKIYELTVMIFRLTNIAVIFYAIVNNLLRNLINSSSIAFFINNISVAMDINKKYDEILGEVLIKRCYKG